MNIIETAAKMYLGKKVSEKILSAKNNESYEGKPVQQETPEKLANEKFRNELQEYGFNPLRMSTAVKAVEEYLTKKNVHYELSLVKYLKERESFIRDSLLGRIESNKESLNALRNLESAKNLIVSIKNNKVSLEKMRKSIEKNMISLVKKHEENLDLKLENELGIKIANLFEDNNLAEIVLSSKPGESSRAHREWKIEDERSKKKLAEEREKKEFQRKTSEYKEACNYLYHINLENISQFENSINLDSIIHENFNEIFEKYIDENNPLKTRRRAIEDGVHASVFKVEILKKVIKDIQDKIQESHE